MSELQQDERTCLTAEEQMLLDNNNAIRAKLIAQLVMDPAGQVKVPGGTADKVLLQALLADSDKVAITKAKLRISNKAAESEKDFRALAAAALMSQPLAKRRPATPEERSLPEDIKPDGVVPGEMDIGVSTFSLAQVMKNA